MKLLALPAFSDNYIWMLNDGLDAVVVDPGDAAPLHAALDAQRLGLTAILVTRHHLGPVGGVDALPPRLQGPARQRAAALVESELIAAAGAEDAAEAPPAAVSARLRE